MILAWTVSSQVALGLVQEIITSAYRALVRLCEETLEPRPREWCYTALENALANWLNFLPLEPFPFLDLESIRRDDANRIRVMSKQLITLGVARDLARCRLDPAAHIVVSSDLACLKIETSIGVVTVRLVPGPDDGAPLGFWPFELRLEGVHVMDRYVAPVLVGCSGPDTVATALDSALGEYYGLAPG